MINTVDAPTATTESVQLQAVGVGVNSSLGSASPPSSPNSPNSTNDDTSSQPFQPSSS
jgi:hypothetical protein